MKAMFHTKQGPLATCDQATATARGTSARPGQDGSLCADRPIIGARTGEFTSDPGGPLPTTARSAPRISTTGRASCLRSIGGTIGSTRAQMMTRGPTSGIPSFLREMDASSRAATPRRTVRGLSYRPVTFLGKKWVIGSSRSGRANSLFGQPTRRGDDLFEAA